MAAPGVERRRRVFDGGVCESFCDCGLAMVCRRVAAFLEEGDMKSMSFILCEGLRHWHWVIGVLRKLRLGLPSKDSSDTSSIRLKPPFRLSSNPKAFFLLPTPCWQQRSRHAPAQAEVKPLPGRSFCSCSLMRAEQASTAGHMPRWRAMAMTSGRSSWRTHRVEE